MTFHWSSVEFREPIPQVWMHSKNPEVVGILRFSSWAELRELTNTLKGALNYHERSKAPRKKTTRGGRK